MPAVLNPDVRVWQSACLELESGHAQAFLDAEVTPEALPELTEADTCGTYGSAGTAMRPSRCSSYSVDSDTSDRLTAGGVHVVRVYGPGQERS